MNNHAEIKQLCLFMGILLIRTIDGKDVLGSAETANRIVEIQRAVIVYMDLGNIRIDHHSGKAGNQIDCLLDRAFQRCIFRVIVIAVHRQHRTCHFVHDVRARRIHNHGLRESGRQFTMRINDLGKVFQIPLVRQLTE